jgi:hypothetical protein
MCLRIDSLLEPWPIFHSSFYRSTEAIWQNMHNITGSFLVTQLRKRARITVNFPGPSEEIGVLIAQVIQFGPTAILPL